MGRKTVTDVLVNEVALVDVSENELQMRLNPNAPEWTHNIPVSVNDTYGDPFIPEQIDNTIKKLLELQNHHAPIAIFTKAGQDSTVLSKLSRVSHIDKIVIFYSLTGLDEAGISFADRVLMIQKLKAIFPKTLVFTRPIIRGRNDSPEMLRKLVEVAKDHTGLLVLGGLHSGYKRKRLERSVEDQLVELCDIANVRSFHKTSCAAAHLFGMKCWMHDLGPPINQSVVEQLGYHCSNDNGRLVLREGTTGDINILRMITRSEVYVDDLRSNYNILTMPTPGYKLEATSSWFAWSENIDVCLDCDYCIIKQIEYLQKKKISIGVHPTRIPQIVDSTGSRVALENFRRTKLKSGASEEYHLYQDMRAVKPCFTHRYDGAMTP